GMALVMAPATESVMGSLPLGKAGVGSAVNDTTRQIGGALGIAVIGSVLSSIYGSTVRDAFAGSPLPADAVDAAGNSLGGAIGVAQRLQEAGNGELAARLIDVANQGFVDA